MNKVLFTIVVSFSVLFATNVQADYRGYKPQHRHDSSYEFKRYFEKRIERQHRRIERACDRGLITYREAKRLKRAHHRLYRLKEDYIYDGYLSRWERRELTNRLDHISEKIYRFKHNYYRS